MPMASPEEQRQYQREWMRRRRLAWIATNGPCRECGSSDDLEVDHIDPSTKVAHKVWSWAREKREAELAKCQVLCRACHLAKTIAQFKRPVPHGTHHGYSHHGCRCQPCRAAHAAYERARRAGLL